MSKRQPKAFMSYARKDDKNLEGYITKFRERLNAAVEFETGEEFDIYQDWKDIGWGQDWKEHIDNSLDEVIFLIPIITPKFLKSESCRDEMKHFISRENKLNRTDLILPVYFKECPEIEEKARNASDPVVESIKSIKGQIGKTSYINHLIQS